MLKRILLVAIGTLFVVSAINAQSNSILKGKVRDQNSAIVRGANVTVAGESLQGTRSMVTDSNGEFAFLGLAPGSYKVTVVNNGFKELRQENVLIRASQTIDLDLALEVQGAAGTVDVTAGADTPIIDTRTPEKNYNISGEFITKLPLNSRQSWEGLWTMIPGVDGFPEGSNYDPVVNGAGNLNRNTPLLNFTGSPNQGIVNTVSNSYTLNGFKIGDSQTNQGWRTQFSTEAIQDVVVKTSGADASTPLAQGGAVNIVTKSGGNQFHGSAGFFMQPKKFNWTNIAGGTSTTLTLYQPDLAFGGPVIFPAFGEGKSRLWKGTDKLWFFVTYRNVVTNEGIARTPALLARFAQFGLPAPDFDKEERSKRFTGKVSYQINNNHSLIFNYLNDAGTSANSNTFSDSAYAQEASDLSREGGPTYQLAWNGTFGSKFFWTAQYGQRDVDATAEAQGGDTPSRTLHQATRLVGTNLEPDTTFPVLLYYANRAGNALYTLTERPYKEFSSDITWLTSFAGEHTFQSGILYRPSLKATTVSVVPTSGITNIDEVLTNGVRIPFRRGRWLSTEFPESERSTKQLGFYVQDKWTITPRLSVTVGGRFDNQVSTDLLGRDLLDAWTFDPRLGFALSLNKQRRDVIRGSWGRYSNLLTIAGSPTLPGSLGGPTFVREYDNDLNGTYETQVVVTAASGVNSNPASGTTLQVIDPNIKVSYKNELQFGYTRQLPFKMVLDASFIQSDFKNQVGNVNTNRIYTNGLFTGLVNPNYNDVLLKTNITNFEQKYRSFQLSLIRNFGSKYSFFANYTYQKRTIAGEFSVDDPNRYFHPQEWYNDDKQVRPHMLAINGDALLPWGFRVAAIFTLESGNYGGYLVKELATTDPEYTRHVTSISVTNSSGVPRNVSNYLSTRIRLLGPRDEGRLQLPWRPKLNLRLGKIFKMPWEGQQIESSVDVFNTFNDATPIGFASTAASTRPDLTASFGTLNLANVYSPRGVQLSFRYRF